MMKIVNLVTAIDRDGTQGHATRLRVGIADIDASEWLVRPVIVDADTVLRRLRSGERFRTLAAGAPGTWLSIDRDDHGLDRIAPVGTGFPSTSMYNDVAPC